MTNIVNIYYQDNLQFLESVDDSQYDLVYIDPPFNTGKTREKVTYESFQDDAAKRQGFGGKNYSMKRVMRSYFADTFDDYLGFMLPRLEEIERVLKDKGSLFFHIDPRESHYCKILLDIVFGEENFQNEIVWSYDFGGKPKNRWAWKHDVIFWYTKDPESYTFHYDKIDRIPYMAPSMVSPEKAEQGKVPTDVWWNTIVPTNGKEKTGYATQKPFAILDRIIRVHTNLGDHVLDCFAGSGTLGAAAVHNGCDATLVDNNAEAIQVMKSRLHSYMR